MLTAKGGGKPGRASQYLKICVAPARHSSLVAGSLVQGTIFFIYTQVTKIC